MTLEVWGMTVVGLTALAAGLILVRERFWAASGAGRAIALGAVFEATALAIFAAEHFLAARDLAPVVPHWLPAPLFWTYLVGAAWVAAAVSLIALRQVRWSASLTALLLLLIVATIDLPNMAKGAHNRFFWILTVRETAFAGGAMVLAGSQWNTRAGAVPMRVGRVMVAAVSIFYGVEHFLFPRNVPGVPLQKMTPAWVPAPVLLAYAVGLVLLAGGIGLMIPRTVKVAAAGSGTVLVLLTALFYVPIAVMEWRTPLAVEGLNYVGDTLLFAATVLLAGTEKQATGIRERGTASEERRTVVSAAFGGGGSSRP